MPRPLTVSLTLMILTLTTLPERTLAHARLDNPPARTMDAGLKVAPCGNIPKGNNPTVLTVGQTVTLRWTETINHPGRFIFALSTNNDQTFTVLKEVLDDQNGPGTHSFQSTLTVPNTLCTNCTLRMVQSMEENPQNPSLYYSCADVSIVNSGGTTTTTSTTTSTTTTTLILIDLDPNRGAETTNAIEKPKFTTGCGSSAEASTGHTFPKVSNHKSSFALFGTLLMLLPLFFWISLLKSRSNKLR